MQETASFDTRYRQLMADLGVLVTLLDRYGYEHWARWLDSDRHRLAMHKGQAFGHILAAFGGMGSLNDILLTDAGAEADMRLLNELRGSVFDNAKALRDESGL